ncbi:unnamed protein product [Ranitomeya imitator]|uniref:Uncharacterized protein n=1 Tax=Ranitomeya imitator TaxID=111125 RepID=A0ABN9M4K4_9NEOB|nr:unnamed protein product [Ranitomeya imitator]
MCDDCKRVDMVPSCYPEVILNCVQLSPCSALRYHHESRMIFVGQDSGAIVEFLVSDDFNKMNFVKTYPAHQNRVTEVIFAPDAEWVISTGQDKFLTWMCTQSGSLVGRHAFTSWASCLQYPLYGSLD